MEWPPTRIRVRALPHSLRAAPFSRTSFDHGPKAQATEASRQYPRPTGCDHRDLESCEGVLEPDTSQGRLWFRQHPTEDDQGMLLLFSDAPVAGSHVTRTP